MSDETKIKLQAYLDGEISGGDAAEISNLLTRDSEAKAFLTELQFVKNALSGNELEIRLPETREFYWSKIQREIERNEKATQTKSSVSWWKPVYMRFAAGLAALCALLMVSFIAFNNASPTKFSTGEVVGTGEDMGVISYHSDVDRMTVVYLVDRGQDDLIDSNSDF